MNEELKTYSIYQIYIRNFTKEGTIKALIKKLDYIKGLGVKIIQLLPINEIGLDGRKGTLGSPYAIKDYYKINPELGTLDDFKELIEKSHELDLLVMMDVVFNHTSRDNELLQTHPEYYYHDSNNKFANRFGNWADVYDLNYNCKELIKYVTDVLCYYTKLGVDGYRFDVASLLPNEFYKYAIPKIKEINPNTIILGEAVEYSFISSIREQGGNALSDGELYDDGFDLLYRYSNWKFLSKFLETHKTLFLDIYKTTLHIENCIYPPEALKIGSIENHDLPRLANYTKYDPMRESLMAFSFFLKGTGFIYCGQECKDFEKPSLFDKDLIDMNIDDIRYFNFTKKLIEYKSNKKNLSLIQTNVLNVSGKGLVLKNIFKDNAPEWGFFNLSENPIKITSPDLEDGEYVDILSNSQIVIKNKTIKINEPLILCKSK